MAGTDRSGAEVAATVRFYLDMLELEIVGARFNKAERNRALRKLLDDRSRGAVERTHQNLSAILIEWGLPYVDGYKPLGNDQALLAEELEIQLHRRVELEENLRALVAAPVTQPLRLVARRPKSWSRGWFRPRRSPSARGPIGWPNAADESMVPGR